MNWQPLKRVLLADLVTGLVWLFDNSLSLTLVQDHLEVCGLSVLPTAVSPEARAVPGNQKELINIHEKYWWRSQGSGAQRWGRNGWVKKDIKIPCCGQECGERHKRRLGDLGEPCVLWDPRKDDQSVELGGDMGS